MEPKFSIPFFEESQHESVSLGKFVTNQFLMDHNFIMSKIKNDRLYCDVCGNEFPAITVFFVIADDTFRTVKCHPCNGVEKRVRQFNTLPTAAAPEKKEDQLSLF